MSTVLNDTTTYATPQDLVARYDVRDICQWVSDANAPVSPSSLGGNANLLAAIADASGMVEAAVLAAERYSVTDLQNLYASGGNSGQFLIRLVCDLAVGLLIERRPYLERDVPAPFLRALEWLEQLRDGKRILAFQEVAQAALPSVIVDSAADVRNRNLASYQANRFFGYDRGDVSVPGNAPGAGASIVP
jgi:phage gp36-like protein